MALAFCGASDAQSLKDILNKVATSEKVGDIVETITGMVISPKDITGTWNYTGSAVKLESSDIVKSAAASVAASQVEKKMDEYLQKIGVKEGMFGFTFNEDKTFSTNFKGKEFNGTYAISEDGKTLYLYYNINTSVLKPNYVVDFGLPFTFPLSAVTNTPNVAKNVTVSARHGSVSYDSWDHDQNILIFNCAHR